MTTLHLGVRVKKSFHSKKDSAVQKHINVCQLYKGNKYLFENFSSRTCNTQYIQHKNPKV